MPKEGDLRQGIQHNQNVIRRQKETNLEAANHLCWKEVEAKVEGVGSEVTENLEYQAEITDNGNHLRGWVETGWNCFIIKIHSGVEVTMENVRRTVMQEN